MKCELPIFLISAATVLFSAGCSKTDHAPPHEAVQQVAPVQGSVAPPSLPPPRLPDPVVPKGAEAASPAPGEAGDTSSEAFKGGGKADPHK